jgi:hypothetical protein
MNTCTLAPCLAPDTPFDLYSVTVYFCEVAYSYQRVLVTGRFLRKAPLHCWRSMDVRQYCSHQKFLWRVSLHLSSRLSLFLSLSLSLSVSCFSFSRARQSTKLLFSCTSSGLPGGGASNATRWEHTAVRWCVLMLFRSIEKFLCCGVRSSLNMQE